MTDPSQRTSLDKTKENDGEQKSIMTTQVREKKAKSDHDDKKVKERRRHGATGEFYIPQPC